MKGPAHRKKVEVCRVWECPECGRRAKTAGTVVNWACKCKGVGEAVKPLWMRLVDELPRQRPLSIPVSSRDTPAPPAAAAPSPNGLASAPDSRSNGVVKTPASAPPADS